MKLVKLVYISHGWHLALTGKPLLDEPVQAWKYGPVVESVYHAYKKFGSSQIDRLIVDLSSDRPLDGETQKFLEHIWELYGKFSGIQLSSLTHQSGTPWHLAYKDGIQGIIIGNDSIESHYKSLLIKEPAS